MIAVLPRARQHGAGRVYKLVTVTATQAAAGGVIFMPCRVA
jgi:hypothetical protein